MSPPSPYEQLKDDLGYLQLGRAAERFAVVAEQAAKETRILVPDLIGDRLDRKIRGLKHLLGFLESQGVHIIERC